MIVVDVNVVVHLLTEGPKRDLAMRLWESDPVWVRALQALEAWTDTVDLVELCAGA